MKPATLGSSVGMTKVHDAEELPAALDFAAEFAQKILVERFISGREIEVSVLGNEDPEASVPGEIIPHREFYDYDAKYLEEGTRLEIPAKLTQRAGAPVSGVRRARLPLPGMPRHGARRFLPRTPHGPDLPQRSQHHSRVSPPSACIPKLWEASGIPYRDLIDRLIDLALAEHREKQRTKYSIELPAGAGGALEA